ncbi:MAG: membrane protein insertase YidC [Candidatus Accumulibacter sp.]|jgi:YidC/Oxa1 family membrane protein insertase|nr:membrane protein insertase YidC [Accumulibacter sp.]
MDNRRLILFCVFFFSLAMLWDAWQKYNNPRDLTPPPSSSVPAAPVSTSAVPPASSANIPAPSASTGADSVIASTPAAPVGKDEIVEVRTDLFVAQVSVRGGDLVGLDLPGYKATEDKSRVFRLFDIQHRYAAQSGLIGEGLPNHKTSFSPLPGKRELPDGEDTIQLKLEAPAVNGVRVTKIYTFRRGSYLIGVTHEIDNGSDKEIAAHAYYQLQRDTRAPAGESSMVNTFTGPAEYTEQGKFQKIGFSDIEKGSAKFERKADNGWMAMIQHYFVSAWIPPEKLQREFYVRSLEEGDNPVVAAGLIVPVPVIAPGSKLDHAVSLYAGPQIQSILNQLAKPVAEGGIGAQGLALVVDYGWLTIVAAPIFWLLEVINKLIGNWGWSIVILTILIKGLFFPLSAASYKSMARMRTLTPRLQALKERCGDDRQKLNMEMMNLYKTEKINPLGGCLPILIQIPVFIALYWALLGAVEMRNAPWILWIHDLSSQDPYYVLPIVMITSMMIQTRLNPTPPDPIQAKVAMIMPFAFGIMFFFFPAGLVLYWVVNNILSIAQQWQITRMIERGGKAANDARA